MGLYFIASEENMEHLTHYGTKGMKWRHRKNPNVGTAARIAGFGQKSYERAAEYAEEERRKQEEEKRKQDMEKLKNLGYGLAKGTYENAKNFTEVLKNGATKPMVDILKKNQEKKRIKEEKRKWQLIRQTKGALGYVPMAKATGLTQGPSPKSSSSRRK